MNILNAEETPKIFSVAGGLLLVFGITLPGFVLLTLSALLNLVSSVRQKNKSNSAFFGAWATINSYFAFHGH
jgi:hypothetical protein